jgi:hypothetical protein
MERLWQRERSISGLSGCRTGITAVQPQQEYCAGGFGPYWGLSQCQGDEKFRKLLSLFVGCDVVPVGTTTCLN